MSDAMEAYDAGMMLAQIKLHDEALLILCQNNGLGGELPMQEIQSLITTLRLELMSALGEAGANLDRAVKAEERAERLREALETTRIAMRTARSATDDKFVHSVLTGAIVLSAEAETGIDIREAIPAIAADTPNKEADHE